jgi:hypothetical protein
VREYVAEGRGREQIFREGTLRRRTSGVPKEVAKSAVGALYQRAVGYDYDAVEIFMQRGPREFSTKYRLGNTTCYAPASLRGGAVGFPPSDSPAGDGRCCGDPAFRPVGGTAPWKCRLGRPAFNPRLRP